MKRFFVEQKNISENNITITGEEYYHLTKVLRFKKGYDLIVCSGDGFDYICSIKGIDSDKIICVINDKVINNSEPIFELVLYASLIKEENYKIIVRKAVEVGATRIVPVITQYTNEKNFKTEKMEKIAIEACKQCGRARIVIIDNPISLDKAIEDSNSYEHSLIAYENEKKTSIDEILDTINEPKSIALFIGPEGGYSDEEYALFVSHKIKSFTLGKRILKAETACIVALGIIINRFDR